MSFNFGFCDPLSFRRVQRNPNSNDSRFHAKCQEKPGICTGIFPVGSGFVFFRGAFHDAEQFHEQEEALLVVPDICFFTLGGDVVDMSTVTEALTAAHCGLPILGLSVITNMAAGVTGAALSGAEVNETGAAIGAKFSAYLKSILKEL